MKSSHLTLYTAAALLLSFGTQAQNLFVATGGSVLEFTPTGIQTTFASGFNNDRFLAFDSTGNLFVSDESGIYEFTPSGTRSTFASFFPGLVPGPLAFNSAGDLFVGTSGGAILKFTPNGTETLFTSDVNNPLGLAFNSAGDLFEADAGSGNIYEFTPGGMRSTFASGLAFPRGLAFNSSGDLFVTQYVPYNPNVTEITPNGAQIIFASGLVTPYSVAFNNAGDLFVSDPGSAYIDEFNPDGTKSVFTSFQYPYGLAFQPTPEPSSLWLALLGTGVWFYVRRTHKKPSARMSVR